MSPLPVLSWTLLLLVQTSVPQDTSSCPSCALARLGGAATDLQSEVVEAVKRHILNMLHLHNPPNVTRPVPRAALLNVLRKLHDGHVTGDGSVRHGEEEESPEWGVATPGGATREGAGPRGAAGDSREDQETSEVITFAEAGDSPGTLTFALWKDGSAGSMVERANVWLFLRLAQADRSRSKVTIGLFHQRRPAGAAAPEVLLLEKSVQARRSGWHSFSVLAALRREDGGVLRLRVSCPMCAGAGASLLLGPPRPGDGRQRDRAHRPFLVTAVQQDDGGEARRRSKRGLECSEDVQVCCKRQLYISFKDIGWSDWIIAPSGYHANYCEGECPNHVAGLAGSTLSFHSTVISHYRLRGYSPSHRLQSCCVPTRLRPMSMLYYNEEQKIIKKDVHNMVVDECGCS